MFHLYLGGFVAVRQPRFDRGSDTGGFSPLFIDETRSFASLLRDRSTFVLFYEIRSTGSVG